MKSKFEAGRACVGTVAVLKHNPFRASTGYLSTPGYVWYPGDPQKSSPGGRSIIQMCMRIPSGEGQTALATAALD